MVPLSMCLVAAAPGVNARLRATQDHETMDHACSVIVRAGPGQTEPRTRCSLEPVIAQRCPREPRNTATRQLFCARDTEDEGHEPTALWLSMQGESASILQLLLQGNPAPFSCDRVVFLPMPWRGLWSAMAIYIQLAVTQPNTTP